MPEALVSREKLMGRLAVLVGGGVLKPGLAAQKLGHLDDRSLANMVDQLESAAGKAAARRKPVAGANARRKELDARREAALVKLEAVADRIRDRRAVRAQNAQDAEALIVEQLEKRHMTHALPPSLALMSAMNVVQQDEVEHFDPIDFRAVDLAQGMIARLDPQSHLTASFTEFSARLHKDAVQAYLHHAVLKSRLDLIRLMGKWAPDDLAEPNINRLLRIGTMRTAAFDPLFIPDRKPSLNPAAAAEALAKLLLFASDFKATRIIALGQGGPAIGRFLESELRRSTRAIAYEQVVRPHPNQYWDRLADVRDAKDNILIVTDFAGDAAPFEGLRESLRSRGHGSTAIIALGARADVHDQLGANGMIYCTHLIADETLLLPWSRSGGYQRTRTAHVFAHDGAKPLRIALDFMANIASSLRTMMGSSSR